MNRINNNLNALTDSDMNFFYLKLEGNRILSNSPINNKSINNGKKSKSPERNKNSILFDKNGNNKFNKSNLRNTHSKLHKNNFQNENKTHYPIINNKPLLTDSNFNKSSINNRNNINEEYNAYLQNKLNKSKLDGENKINLNLVLTNNSSNNNHNNRNKYSESKFNENHYFKNNINNNKGNETDNDCKNPLFSSVNLSTRYLNKTNKNFNDESSLKNIYSSYNNSLFSNQANNKQMQITNSSTGFLFNKNNLRGSSNEIIQEEKKPENYSVSNTEPNSNEHKSSLNFNLDNNNNNKYKLNFSRKKTPPQVLNTDFNVSMLLLNKSKSEPISLSTLDIVFNGYEKAKAAKKRISNLIRSYAANTYQGLVR